MGASRGLKRRLGMFASLELAGKHCSSIEVWRNDVMVKTHARLLSKSVSIARVYLRPGLLTISVSIVISLNFGTCASKIPDPVVSGLQGVSSGIAKVADGGRLLGARCTLTHFSHGLVVVANDSWRRLVHVPDAAAAKRGLARCIVRRRSVDVAGVLFDRCLDVTEDRAFDERPCRSTFDGVADVVIPEVVDYVDDGVTSELGRAALGVVDVVVLEGDCVLGAGQVHGPVVVGVTASGPLGLAIDEVVGDRDACIFGVAGHNMLASDERCLSKLLGISHTLDGLEVRVDS